ncbi:MAG: PQQ-binding-like beta-propeller repeat protein [Flavobacteriales bacterium]|nr:PQQ-binding-like beta-propeller repeat protein [Flavobacteriales bacterium]MCB9449707.1 PQQ-binding-like beta-propeller repeat protein [Flavobacteriales bacterium]
MKKSIFIHSLLAMSALTCFAQEDMTTVWEQRLEHSIAYSGTGLEERGYSYAASDKEMTVFSNKDGHTIWSKPFKEIAPNLRKIDELIPFWESNTVFLFERKMGKDQVACIDIEKGTVLWTTDKYQNLSEDNVVYIAEKEGFALSLKESLVFIKARTGEELWSTSKFKGVVGKYVYRDNQIVTVNFVPGGLAALFSGFKNQIAKIDLNNGDVLWEQTYVGRAERKVVTREFVFDLDLKDDMVVLKMNGIQTYDWKTGAKLWAAAFDFTADVVGSPAGATAFGIYGAVAEPIWDGDDVYVLDMSNKKSQYVKKYDRNTGKLLWTSPEIKGARAIPAMGLAGDKIILQIGGTVECQAIIRKKDSEGNITIERKVWWPDVKPWGLKAINTNDGSVAWESERFKKGISNSFTVGDNAIVCSGKAIYSLKVADGTEVYEVELKDDDIGRGEQLMLYEDKAIVIGSKGVSSHNVSDGKLVASGRYKSSALEDSKGDYLIMKTEGADIASFYLKDCTYKKFNARKGATTTLTEEGDYVYVYEKKTVTKVATK